MHGRIRGRKLTQKQSLYLRNHSQELLIDEFSLADLFSNMGRRIGKAIRYKKICLEIGFGSGEHLTYQAERNLEYQFIGCDYYVNGIASTVVKVVEKELGNVKLFNGDALHLLGKIPDLSLSEVYLLYPDPWPKVKHLKRRFVNTVNLELLASKLKKNGLFKVVTDSESYFSHIKSLILMRENSKHFNFENKDFSVPWGGWQATKYEEKAKKAGRRSYYMVLRKTNATLLSSISILNAGVQNQTKK